jgi:hypothetical protein
MPSKFAWAMVVTFVFIVDAQASQCDGILKLEQQRSEITTKDRRQATRNFACSHSYKEFGESYGAGASLKFGSVGGSGEYNESNYQKFRESHCTDASSSDFESGFRFSILRDASPGVVSAWQDCMRSQSGFSCWAEPHETDIAIVLNSRNPEQYKLDGVVLSGAKLKSAVSDIAVGTPLLFGEKRIVVERNNKSTPVSATINIRGDIRSDSCRAMVPAEYTIPEPKEVVTKLSVTGWVSHGGSRHSINIQPVNYSFTIPIANRVDDFMLTVTQFTDDRRCAEASISAGALNWPPGTTMDSTPVFGNRFQIGAQVAANRLIQVFVDPKICPPFD